MRCLGFHRYTVPLLEALLQLKRDRADTWSFAEMNPASMAHRHQWGITSVADEFPQLFGRWEWWSEITEEEMFTYTILKIANIRHLSFIIVSNSKKINWSEHNELEQI